MLILIECGCFMVTKNNMQQLLLPDYLDGSVEIDENKNIFMVALKQVTACYPYIIESSNLSVGIEFPEDVYHENRENCINIKKILNTEPALLTMVRIYRNYVNEKKNYIFSSGLVEALKNTSTDIKVSHLPRYFCGYIVMPNLRDNDGEKIEGVFILIKNNVVYCSGLVNRANGTMINFIFELDRADTVSDVAKLYNYSVRHKDGVYLDIDNTPGFLIDYQRTVLNGIMYICSTDADLKYRVNNFSTKKKKLNVQKKIYTSSPFTVVGEDFSIYVNKEMKNNVYVRPHWRWQACGPRYSMHKLVYVKEYTKNKRDNLHE